MPVYNKAVRDRIPEIIEDSGHQCEYRVLTDHEFLPLLEEKLGEELLEYMSSKSLVELADIMEVIHRLATLKGSNIAEGPRESCHRLLHQQCRQGGKRWRTSSSQVPPPKLLGSHLWEYSTIEMSLSLGPGSLLPLAL